MGRCRNNQEGEEAPDPSEAEANGARGGCARGRGEQHEKEKGNCVRGEDKYEHLFLPIFVQVSNTKKDH